MRGSETFTIVWSSAARNMVASTPASTSALRRGGSVMPGGRSSPAVSTARPMAIMPRAYPSSASAASTRSATSSGTQALQTSRRVRRNRMAASSVAALFSSSHSTSSFCTATV